MSITSRKDPREQPREMASAASAGPHSDADPLLRLAVSDAIEFQRTELLRLREEIAHLRQENLRLTGLAEQRIVELVEKLEHARQASASVKSAFDSEMKTSLRDLRAQLSRLIDLL